MASILRKLLKQPQVRQTLLAKSLNPTKPVNLLPLLSVHQSQIEPHYNNFTPNPILTVKDNFFLRDFSHIYPSFAFGHCLDSVSQSGFVSVSEENVDDGLGSNDAGTMWADSVKKKRKKKMNKHKLRKLRKCLRRKT